MAGTRYWLAFVSNYHLYRTLATAYFALKFKNRILRSDRKTVTFTLQHAKDIDWLKALFPPPTLFRNALCD